MSDQENLDLNRVIGAIMENPQLIEQISGLMKQKKDSQQEQKSSSLESEADIKINDDKSAPVTSASSSFLPQRGNRAQLLGALKPYVSEERAKAIDSVISIADILDMMRAR